MPTLNSYDYIHEDGEQGEVIVGDLHYVTADHEDIGGIWKNTQALRENLAEHGRNVDVVAVGRDGSINPIYLDMSTTSPAVHVLYLDDGLLDYKIAGVALQRAPGIMVWPGHTR